jgi:hypothetical protein
MAAAIERICAVSAEKRLTAGVDIQKGGHVEVIVLEWPARARIALDRAATADLLAGKAVGYTRNNS